MDWQRYILIGGIAICLLMLIQRYSAFEDAKVANAPSAREALIIGDVDLPVVDNDAVNDELPVVSNDDTTPEVGTQSSSKIVTVITDQLELVIDTTGGDILYAALRKHLTKLEENGQPFVLLNKTNSNLYIAQSGLVGKNGTDTADGRPSFTVEKEQYELKEGEDKVVVDLHYQLDNVSYIKRFSIARDSYTVNIEYIINNQSSETWQANFYGQIKRDSHQPLVTSTGVRPFLGAAITTNDDKYRKYDFDDIADEQVKEEVKGGFVAMVQHYFLTAWVPPQEQENSISLRKARSQDIYYFGFTSPTITVKAGETASYVAQYFIGPKDQDRLEALSEELDRTVDYGWLWFIAKPFFLVLRFIHDIVGNWGWAIIAFTVMIKFALYPLSAASMRSMAKMRKLTPEMTRLKDLYGDDRQKMSQEMMAMYKKHKVNPAGGCLPILLQMPVFLALYWVLLESVEIRHAPWILWINDLSDRDPFFILPLFMGASMWFMQKMQPVPPDPMQAKVMKIMPIAFTFFFMIFPAGLVLYWTVNNVLSMAQQWFVNKQIESEGK